jgi:hypothetical protein
MNDHRLALQVHGVGGAVQSGSSALRIEAAGANHYEQLLETTAGRHGL